MALTTPPNEPTPALAQIFNSNVNAFMLWAETIPEQVNALISGSVSATSTSSVSIGTGAKTFTLEASQSFYPGMLLMCWNAKTDWMLIRCTSYTSATKSLIGDVVRYKGSGSKSSWTISLHGLSADMPSSLAHRVRLTGGNGAGSTKTRIRRFTTTAINTGTAITYADSATDGASFTINEAHWYGINYQDKSSANVATNYYLGLSLNFSDTDGIELMTAENRLAISRLANGTPTAEWGSVQLLRYFNEGDVIRPCLSSNYSTLDTTALVSFDIFKLP